MRCAPVLALVLVAACGHDSHDDPPPDCDLVTGADEFVVGLQKDGGQGVLDFKMMSADPAPPARGDNTWIVEVADGNGAPLEGATLRVTPFMPSHGHGSPITPVIMAGSVPGQYVVSPVNLWMPGVWETTVRATAADGTTTDTALYTFCVD